MKIEFWTSTEYSGFMENLISELTALGFEARQRFLISESSYRGASGRLGRLWLRVKQYGVYPVYLLTSIAWGRVRGAWGRVLPFGKLRVSERAGEEKILVVSTNTFYAPLLATLFHKRVVHLVYDLFPEAFLEAEGSARAF